MRRKLYLWFCILSLTGSANALAQRHWLEASGGPALSYATKGNNFSSLPRAVPHGGITAFIPFNDWLALKTGTLYQQKKLRYFDQIDDSLLVTNSISSETEYHYLSLPLQLAWTFHRRSDHAWRLTAGMSYGILLKATKRISFDTYDDGRLVDARTITFDQKIGLDPGENYPGLPGEEGTALYVFTPAARLDLSYEWKRKIVLGWFYEYNLQDMRMRLSDSRRRLLQATGLSLGVIIR